MRLVKLSDEIFINLDTVSSIELNHLDDGMVKLEIYYDEDKIKSSYIILSDSNVAYDIYKMLNSFLSNKEKLLKYVDDSGSKVKVNSVVLFVRYDRTNPFNLSSCYEVCKYKDNGVMNAVFSSCDSDSCKKAMSIIHQNAELLLDKY